tara:strand:+ start:281 stop:478 length:198 start_codon:yes stop_codon:yes gene_type:complete
MKRFNISRKDFISKLTEAMADGAIQKKYRQTFINLIAKTRRGKQPNTPPFTKKANIGKSGPVGMP